MLSSIATRTVTAISRQKSLPQAIGTCVKKFSSSNNWKSEPQKMTELPPKQTETLQKIFEINEKTNEETQSNIHESSNLPNLTEHSIIQTVSNLSMVGLSSGLCLYALPTMQLSDATSGGLFLGAIATTTLAWYKINKLKPNVLYKVEEKIFINEHSSRMLWNNLLSVSQGALISSIITSHHDTIIPAMIGTAGIIGGLSLISKIKSVDDFLYRNRLNIDYTFVGICGVGILGQLMISPMFYHMAVYNVLAYSSINYINSIQTLNENLKNDYPDAIDCAKNFTTDILWITTFLMIALGLK